jgi:hypothetical protein
MIGLSVSFVGRGLQWWAGHGEKARMAGIARHAERFDMQRGFYPICIVQD